MQVKLRDEVFRVEVTKKKMKNMYLRVIDENTLKVSCPRSASHKDILRLIESHEDWIFKQRKKRVHKANREGIHSTMCIFGNTYPAYYQPITKGKEQVVLKEDGLYFQMKENSLEKSEKLFETFAKQVLMEEVEKRKGPYEAKYGKNHPRIVYRKMTSRWGVCHISKNYITMNTRLIHYPIQCLEYVLLHEYVHFKVPNHAKAFYAEIETMMPNYKEAIALLK